MEGNEPASNDRYGDRRIMKAKLAVTRWEESALHWPQARRDAIQFARVTRSNPEDASSPVTGLWAVYRKGTILEGESAENAIAQGVAVEVTE
jgi:hypothetical protein